MLLRFSIVFYRITKLHAHKALCYIEHVEQSGNADL